MRIYFYELVYIVKPSLSDEETERVLEKVDKTIKNFGGEIVDTEKWGKRQLAYPIKDYDRGYYVLEHIKTNNGDFVKNLENFFKINEDTIRFLTFRLNKGEVKELLDKQKAKEEKPKEEKVDGKSE